MRSRFGSLALAGILLSCCATLDVHPPTSQPSSPLAAEHGPAISGRAVIGTKVVGIPGAVNTGGGSSGVSSLNGQTGAVLAPITEANVAALTAQASAGLSEGAEAYVVTLKAMFVLQASTTTAVPLVNIAASGKTGYQWIRQLVRNPVWEVVSAWTIDPTNTTGVASDECVGTSSACPLLTWAEHSRRIWLAVIGQNVATTVLGTQQAGDNALYNYLLRPGFTHTMTGTPTVLFTSTVTSFTAMTSGSAAADDAELGDTAVPNGSWTAAGALAKGIIIKRTNGTVIWCYALKDLGSTTLRVNQPFNPTSANSKPAFAIGDTYQVLQLPQILSFRLTDAAVTGLTLNTFDWHQSGFGMFPFFFFQNCYISLLQVEAFQTGALFRNVCLDTGAVTLSAGAGSTQGITITGGAIKGTGTTTISLFGQVNAEGQIVCMEGARLQVADGWLRGAQFNFYDVTSSLGMLYSDTGGNIHLLGPVNGMGNTAKIVQAHQGTQFINGTLAIASMYNASITSDAAPIQAGTTTSTSQINIQTDGNGVIFSQ